MFTGASNQARTLLEDMPDFMHIANTKHPEKSKKLAEGESYFDLQAHLDKIIAIENANSGEYAY